MMAIRRSGGYYAHIDHVSFRLRSQLHLDMGDLSHGRVTRG